MKVIHLVLGKANPQRMNGVSKVAHYHAVYLHKLGIDTEIWGITKTPAGEVAERPFTTRLFRAQSVVRGLEPSLLMALERVKANTVFHIHGALIHDFYMVTKILREKKIPYIYTPHGAFNKVALRKNRFFKSLYIAQFEKQILKDAKKVHFLGKSEYDNISTLVQLDNKVIIPNGQCFEELNYKYSGIPHKHKMIFGFCGRLDNYYKGLDLLIEGFAKYREASGNGELWIIGDGPDRQQLEQMVIALKLAGAVTFFGAKYNGEKLNYIANMDVFVHTSHSEGSPTAVLEAAALKRPLLVSTGTNIGQSVEKYKCGIHIYNNTPEAITKALQTFEMYFDKGTLTEMQANSIRMIEEEFSWPFIAKQLADLYI
jgi:glycosyltransferase involved in cell wall biosynthesis